MKTLTTRSIAGLVILSTILLFTLEAKAQLSKSQIENFVTNGSTRSWQFKDYKKTLGSECIGKGQLFVFFENGKVQCKHCVNGKIDYVELNWSIIPVDSIANGEWQLVLSKSIEIEDGAFLKTVRIDLPLAEVKRAGKKMVWRVVPDCSTCLEQTVTLISKN